MKLTVDALAGLAWNYQDRGATAGALPQGQHHVRREQVIGSGPACFAEAAARLLSWEMHRRSGLTVQTSAAVVAEGSDVLLGFGIGRTRLPAPCRVVYVLDEPTRRGFAYGTLTGHPEAGEELFVVTLRPDGQVALAITAFSRAALWWSRLGGPVNRLVQAAITRRYLRALEA